MTSAPTSTTAPPSTVLPPDPTAGAVPPAMLLRELVFGAACAGAVRAAASLRLPDALDEEPASAERLAERLGVEPGPLRRLLRALACYEVFAEDADGRYRHTQLSRLLRSDEPGSLRDIALWCTEPWTWQSWSRLDDAVRTGRSVFGDAFGKEFFHYLHDDAPESAALFNRAMTQSSRQSAQDLADFLDLTGVSSVADIGGGQGQVLAELMERHPGLHGTLLDLPKVVEHADPRLLPGGPLAGRARLVPGDCRTAVPVQADLYLVKNILEWDDDSTRRTLRNLREVARPGARVVIVENLVDDSPSMRFTTAMDLLLLLNVGGAKHTLGSLTALIAESGLVLDAVAPVNPYLHAFSCTVA
ncbi:methyltransferase [Kitasatospora phosalacinea]|uniref:methyltransferase n=1 Tax=Kitasatospora phosalacinea TaxID=2065 RepID=UPI0009DD42AF|nr:methyltransferase [Kitasatospora phosalacinea]